MGKDFIGQVNHVFMEKGIIKVFLTKNLKIGDTIIIDGDAGSEDSDGVTLKVNALSIEGINVELGYPGDTVEINVVHKIKLGSAVYKI